MDPVKCTSSVASTGVGATTSVANTGVGAATKVAETGTGFVEFLAVPFKLLAKILTLLQLLSSPKIANLVVICTVALIAISWTSPGLSGIGAILLLVLTSAIDLVHLIFPYITQLVQWLSPPEVNPLETTKKVTEEKSKPRSWTASHLVFAVLSSVGFHSGVGVIVVLFIASRLFALFTLWRLSNSAKSSLTGPLSTEIPFKQNATKLVESVPIPKEISDLPISSQVPIPSCLPIPSEGLPTPALPKEIPLDKTPIPESASISGSASALSSEVPIPAKIPEIPVNSVPVPQAVPMPEISKDNFSGLLNKKSVGLF